MNKKVVHQFSGFFTPYSRRKGKENNLKTGNMHSVKGGRTQAYKLLKRSADSMASSHHTHKEKKKKNELKTTDVHSVKGGRTQTYNNIHHPKWTRKAEEHA